MTATAEETAREIVRTTDLNNVERGQRLIDKITAALLAHGAAERARAMIAASECPMPELHPGFEPTQENKTLWSVAHANGVLSACEAIRALPSAGPVGDGDLTLSCPSCHFNWHFLSANCPNCKQPLPTTPPVRL
jgi:hypothetical protein